MCKIRIRKENEKYIPSTMVDCVNKEVILKERKWFIKPSKKYPEGIPTEEIIEEILNHEFVHIEVGKIEGDVVSQALDRISVWLAFPERKYAKLLFFTKDKVTYQLPEEEYESLLEKKKNESRILQRRKILS